MARSISAAVRDLHGRLHSLNQHVTFLRGEVPRGVIRRWQLAELTGRCVDAHAAITPVAGVPGVAAWVKDDTRDPTMDIVALYGTAQMELLATRDFIVANLPASPSGALELKSFTAGGQVQDIMAPQSEKDAVDVRLAGLQAALGPVSGV